MERLNTSFTTVVIHLRKFIAHIDDALWQNQTKHIVWATIDTKQEQLKVYYREKNAEEAGLVKIYEYKIGENVKIFEEMF